MGRYLVVATAGAGGDLQPLIASAMGLRDRGHETVFLGDRSVQRSLGGLGLEVRVLPEELDLGPWLIAAIQEAMAATGGDAGAAGPIVLERMKAWARDVAGPVGEDVRDRRPDALVTSLFGVEVLDTVSPPCPWAVVNSTFYVGPGSPRTLEEDMAPRAIPLLRHYAGLLDSASLVLHATDPEFDFGFDGLPSRHYYVGPLGIWEPPSEPSPYLDEPGDPWVLVTISSQRQDDTELAEAALTALADRPVRVIATVGAGRAPEDLSTVSGNARVERVVSHSAVLERGVLLVSHAGHGSVMKALWHGRPMVLVPWGRDQPGVAARAEALGVARVVPREDASRETLSTAIDRVLADEMMSERSAQHAARLQATDPNATAATLLEGLL
jgi:UDP:flavonoid glycosyltransferase YjiC (YdhE family)